MNLTKSIFLIGLISLITLVLIAGCSTQITPRVRITGNTQRYVYEPHPISLQTDFPKHTPTPTPTPRFRSTGSLQGITIIVDPGHGGKDPGAGEKTFSNVPEKTINLAISKELANRLRAMGAKVVMSRTNDTFIELDTRAALPGRYNANLLVSIHADSNPDRYMRGACVYVSRNRSYTSFKTAKNIKASIQNSGIAFRKIDNRDFRVLAKHSKPAVLVECGYMTNTTDARILNQNWYRTKIATAIANGIANSF